MITVYAAWRNQDMTEGRGPMVIDKVFFQEEDANTYIMQQDGVMGRKPSQFGKDSWDGMGDWQVKPLDILESLEDGEAYVQRKLVEQAYRKLSPAEQAAVEAHVRAALT